MSNISFKISSLVDGGGGGGGTADAAVVVAGVGNGVGEGLSDANCSPHGREGGFVDVEDVVFIDRSWDDAE